MPAKRASSSLPNMGLCFRGADNAFETPSHPWFLPSRPFFDSPSGEIAYRCHPLPGAR